MEQPESSLTAARAAEGEPEPEPEGVLVGGRFVLERCAGSGGMGAVFFARDQRDGSAVAVKIMTGVDPADAERFSREVGILAGLQHPGIVRYIAHGLTLEEAPFVAMEWLEGSDLGQILEQRRLALGETITLARRAAEALAFAHERGIVHRDVKPGNLFLVGGDVERVKLIDFGIARVARLDRRLTRTGMIVGTPAYMAPEQIQGASAPQPSSDVFSLGCVFYECLTGAPAFDGTNLMAQLAKVLFQEAPSVRALAPDAPPPLDRLVGRMLSKTVRERPANGAAVAAELTRIAEQSGAWTLPPPSGFAATVALSRVSAGPVPTRDEQRVVTLVLAGDPDAAAPWRGRDEAAVGLRIAIAPYGGRVDALGEGSLIVTVWGGESAVDRAERAAQCALSLRARFPSLPVSMTTGRGRVAAKVVEGAFLDKAIRSLGWTRAGVVRLDRVTADMLRARFRVDEEGPELFLRDERPAGEGAALLLGKPSPCVGRSRELSVLEGLLSGCAGESRATVAVVTGAPGAGKSRLGRELVDKIRQRGDAVTIVSGRGASVGAGSPFWILADAIRQAAAVREGDLPTARREKLAACVGRHVEGLSRARVIAFLGAMSGIAFPDAGEAFLAASESPRLMGDSMRAAFQDWLAAECDAQPVLLVLEDLQWGDASTVSLIDATLRNLHDRPLMVLAFARPEVHALFPDLWSEREVQPVKLAPLGQRACEKLVTDALGEGAAAVMDRIIDRAGGNPLYLEELIRAVAAGRGDALPDSIPGAMEARIDAEGSEAKRVLRAASVFGERFSRDGVAALLGGHASRAEAGEWLDLLAARELIAATGSTGQPGDIDYAFRHALLREAASAMLSDADRVLGHRLAAAWLEQVGTDDMVIAEHFRQGGEPACAVGWYQRAAERALEANDLGAALDRVALGVAAGAEGEALGALGLIESEARVRRGELELAEVQSQEVTTLLARGSAPWFRAVTQAVNAAGPLGGLDRVLLWAAPVIAAVPEGGALGAQVSCLAWIATHLIFGGRHADADAVLAALGRAAGDLRGIEPQAIAGLHGVRAIRATVTGELGAGRDGFRAALAAFEQTGDQRNAAAARSNLGLVLGELGDLAGAEEALRGALAAAERMGLHDLTTASLHDLGRVVARLGRVEEARALELRALDAAEALRAAPPLRAGALSVLARALVELGAD